MSGLGQTFLGKDEASWGSNTGWVDVLPSCTPPSCPPSAPPPTPAEASTVPIHVLIASFRDRLCPRTLHNLFSKAEAADRLRVYVIQQTEPGVETEDDADIWDAYCSRCGSSPSLSSVFPNLNL